GADDEADGGLDRARLRGPGGQGQAIGSPLRPRRGAAARVLGAVLLHARRVRRLLVAGLGGQRALRGGPDLHRRARGAAALVRDGPPAAIDPLLAPVAGARGIFPQRSRSGERTPGRDARGGLVRGGGGGGADRTVPIPALLRAGRSSRRARGGVR